MATVDKNFRIKNGLVVEGSTATVGGNDVLTKKQADQDYIINLIGGTATSANTANAVVKRDGNGDFSAGTITANLVGNVTGTVSSLSNHNTGDLTEGSNLYFTNQRALDATASAYDAAGAASSAQAAAQSYADLLALNYDPIGSATTAQNNAESYTDGKIGTLVLSNTVAGEIQAATSGTLSQAQSYTDQTITNLNLAGTYDALGAASAAQAAANSYTNTAIGSLDTSLVPELPNATNKYYTDSRVWAALSGGSGIAYDSLSGQISVDNTIATKSYVDTSISNLVNGAPALLDTLNELAAAINNDANYFTTIANQIASKQNTLTAGSNIDITNNVISVTGLNTDNVAEGSNLYFTNSRAQAAVDGTDRSFTSVEINSVAKQVAAETGTISPAAQTTAYSWNKASYRSGKFTIKVTSGTHTEVSEMLVTLDTSDNVYLTEYGMSSTSGSALASSTVDVSGNNVRIRVTPVNDNSKVVIMGTLL